MTGSNPLAKAVRIAKAAVDLKAENLVALDVRELTSFADVFILATGGSDRHVRAIADAVEEVVEELGERPLGIEGYDQGRWLLLDLGDVIVHIFQSEVREHYDLERLWSEAPRLDLLNAEALSVTR
jgi:ribosome-associated protein